LIHLSHPELTRERSIRFLLFEIKLFSSITQQSLDLQICLFVTFSFKMYIPTKTFKIKGYKIMLKGPNSDRKSQFSQTLTETCMDCIEIETISGSREKNKIFHESLKKNSS